MSKKLLALLLAMIMVIGSFTSVLADTKTDAKADEKKATATDKVEDKKDEAKPEEKTEEKKEEKKEDPALTRAIEVLKKAGFISGFSKETEDFKAEQNVTRAQFASMIVRVKGSEKAAEMLKSAPTGFTDVPVTHWANGYIAIAKNAGYVNGYPDGSFKPEGQITYAEMATMLTIALGKNEAGDRFPQSYIMKAQQLGLFKDVEGVNFTDMATRGDVFKMVYNMITSKEFANRKILKAIVLENARVENLADNEVTVEVIDVVQKANWADASRDKKGDQHKYVLDKDLMLDAENLLGKVVDITVDQNDKIVEVKADDTYKVIEGAVTDVTRNKIGINRTNYSVGFDERYDETDERIFRTYLNDKNFAYRDFAQKYTADKAYDFARVTLKNGKVIFIDAYQFDDIAPVTQVKDGAVYYRDDTRNANEFKAANLQQVRFHDAKGFSVADKKDIVKDDVIHFYNDYECAIVRKDAKVETELVKTHRDIDGKEYAVGKDAEYRLVYVNYLKAIFSLEGKYFNVVESRADLKPIIKDKVTILLGLNNSVQLIESAKAWKDGVHAVKRVYSKGEVELLPPRGDKFWASETRDTVYENYLVVGDTNNKRLLDFEYDDIVYYAGSDKNEIARMGVLLKKRYTIPASRKYVDNNGDIKVEPVAAKEIGYLDNFERATLSARYISSGVKNYRYFNNLNAYYLDKYGELQQVRDWDAFYKYNKDNDKLESYVMSEARLKTVLKENNVDTFNFISSAKDIASIVIFKNAIDSNYEEKYAVVTDLWFSTNEIRCVDANNNEYIVTLDKKLPADIDEKDIVLLNLEKASLAKKEKNVIGHVVKQVIDRYDDTVRFEKLRPTNTFEVTENSGIRREVYFDADTNEFDRQSTDYAQIYTEKDEKTGKEFVVVIRYMDRAFGGTVNKYSKMANLVSANYAEVVVDDVVIPVTPRIYFLAKGQPGEFGIKGLPNIMPYVGGKVLVTKSRNGEVVSIEGLHTAEEVDVENARVAIEDYGKVDVAAASSAPYATEVAANQTALEKLMKKIGLDKKVTLTVSYKAKSGNDPEGFYTEIKTTSTTSTAKATAYQGMNKLPAAPAVTDADKAKAAYAAIDKYAHKNPIKALVITPDADPAKDPKVTVDKAKVLAEVLNALELVVNTEEKEELFVAEFPALKGLNLTTDVFAKIKIDSVTAKKDEKGKDTNVYEVVFKYDTQAVSDAFEFTLTDLNK